MKNTLKKRTFISAIAMLVVSAIVLTSSTFAWFSMATRVEVETMELNITSPDGVQLSANTNAFTTMLGVADIKGESTARWAAYEGNQNNFPELLAPSSSVFEVERSLPAFYAGSINDQGRLSASRVTSDAGSGYVAFDIFVKVGTDMPIYWNKTTLTCDDNTDVPSAMRVALVNCGTVGAKAEATEILSVRPADNYDNRTVMFEPNSRNHTDASGYEDGAAGVPDWYLNDNLINRTPTGNGNNIFKSDALSLATRASDVDTANMFFNAKAGINRIRVYVWLEGNDVDCENSVAGSTINFHLVLSMYQA